MALHPPSQLFWGCAAVVGPVPAGSSQPSRCLGNWQPTANDGAVDAGVGCYAAGEIPRAAAGVPRIYCAHTGLLSVAAQKPNQRLNIRHLNARSTRCYIPDTRADRSQRIPNPDQCISIIDFQTHTNTSQRLFTTKDGFQGIIVNCKVPVFLKCYVVQVKFIFSNYFTIIDQYIGVRDIPFFETHPIKNFSADRHFVNFDMYILINTIKAFPKQFTNNNPIHGNKLLN